MVWIKFSKEEKYGRLMGKMYKVSPKSEVEFTGNELCLNDWMVEQGYGCSYDGGKKAGFTKKELEALIAKN